MKISVRTMKTMAHTDTCTDATRVDDDPPDADAFRVDDATDNSCADAVHGDGDLPYVNKLDIIYVLNNCLTVCLHTFLTFLRLLPEHLMKRDYKMPAPCKKTITPKKTI